MEQESKILDVKVNFGLTMAGVLAKIDKMLAEDKPHYICTTNPEFIMAAQKDAEFKDIINKSDLSLPDGAGVIMAKHYLDRVQGKNGLGLLSKLLVGLKVGFASPSLYNKNRITGVDLFWQLCEQSHVKGYSLFLLGGWPKDKWGNKLEIDYDFAQLAAQKVKEQFPQVNIIGATSEFSYHPKDDVKTLAYIKKCMKEADISYLDVIFVAYNHINQEKWLLRNMHKLSARLGIGVGGTFDYVVGTYTTPGEFVRSYNLEWLLKLVTQPWRIKRIFSAFPTFPLHVFKKSLR